MSRVNTELATVALGSAGVRLVETFGTSAADLSEHLDVEFTTR